jgi:hypothetical protein
MRSPSAPHALLALALVCMAASLRHVRAELQPLRTVYHYASDGDWLGPRVTDRRLLAVLEDGYSEDEQDDLSVEGTNRRLAEVVSLRGDVALTTATGTCLQANGQAKDTCASPAKCTFAADENIYGPFEAGFSSKQDTVIRDQMGCTTPTKCYSEGGVDVHTAEAICAHECGITLPRTDGGVYYGFLDTCGGHTRDYHFHTTMRCLYSDAAGSTHSPQLAKVMGGKAARRRTRRLPPDCHPNCPPKSGGGGGGGGGSATANGQLLFGQWEDFSKSSKPKLDACGGHYGATPASDGQRVYHYHVQEHPPFTLGCVGPNTDGSLVTVEQCRAVNPDKCSDTASIIIFTVKLANGTSIKIPYQPDCPCFDASGRGLNGAGLNVGNVKPTRAWHTRVLSGDSTWSNGGSGTFANHPDPSLRAGFTIVPLPAITDTGPGGSAFKEGDSNGLQDGSATSVVVSASSLLAAALLMLTAMWQAL